LRIGLAARFRPSGVASSLGRPVMIGDSALGTWAECESSIDRSCAITAAQKCM
jgi:hypothetical protein